MPREVRSDEVTVENPARRTKSSGWIAAALFVAVWVFVVFFLDGILSRFIEHELITQTASATHQEYRLSFTGFRYHRGSILAKGMDLVRNGYRTSERGTTLRELSADSARVSGICWWNILFGSSIDLSDLHSYATRVYLCDAAEERERTKHLLPDSVPKTSSTSHFALDLSTIEIPNVRLYGQRTARDYEAGMFSFQCADFSYDSKPVNSRLTAMPVAMKEFTLNVPWVRYADSSGTYFVRNAWTSSKNSMAVDTFSYSAGSGHMPLALGASHFHIRNIDLLHSFSSKGIHIGSIRTQTWRAKFTTISNDTVHTPDTTFWQKKLARSIGVAISIDTIGLQNGDLDVAMPSNASTYSRGLTLRAIRFNLDTIHAANEPLFSSDFSLAANEASYSNGTENIGARMLSVNVPDSLITAQQVIYGSNAKIRKAPLQFGELRAEGVRFPKLLKGVEVEMASLRAHSWNVSGLPASNGKKSKRSKSANSIWELQNNIAESVSIPVRIGIIELKNGTVHITGGSTPTIDANRAGIEAVDFDLDKADTKSLLFSKDLRIGAGTLHFADPNRHNIVDATNVRTRLEGRSLMASHIVYISRSPFEPELNNTAYGANDLKLRGIDFPGLFSNKEILVKDASATSWKIERKSDTVSNPEKTVEKEQKPAWQLPIRIRHANLPNGAVLFWEPDTIPGTFAQTLRTSVTALEVNHFHFLPPHKKRPRIGYRQVLCTIPSFTLAPLDGFYTFEMRNIHADLADSIVTMDTLGYIPKYSEKDFAALHKYRRGRTDFRLSNDTIGGIDARSLINGGGVIINRFASPSLWIDYYKDDTRPKDPTPDTAVMPNDLIRSLNLPFTVQNILLENGHIQLRELDSNQDSSGYFTFDSVSVAASPITLDSASPEVDTPTRIEMNGVFIAQAPMHVKMYYPLHDSALNLTLKGIVGPFDLTNLNSYLIPDGHVQVMNGRFSHGDVDVTIRNDIATCYVEPLYNHFKLRVLPPRADDKRDLEEKIKTLVANTFILRDDDPDEKGGPPITATTTLARKPEQEYFQFLWFAIRQSLGKVVGGFK